MPMRYNSPVASSNLSGQAAGTVVGGPVVEIGDNARQKVRNLSALISITLNTASLTATFKWQVSNDGTTWVDVTNGSQNAAGVSVGTGSIAALSRAFEAPQAVYGWRKARIAFTTGGATGGVADAYSLGYCYRSGA